jgi:hypothetical protein
MILLLIENPFYLCFLWDKNSIFFENFRKVFDLIKLKDYEFVEHRSSLMTNVLVCFEVCFVYIFSVSKPLIYRTSQAIITTFCSFGQKCPDSIFCIFPG